VVLLPADWRDHVIGLKKDYAALMIRFEEKVIDESFYFLLLRMIFTIPSIRIIRIC